MKVIEETPTKLVVKIQPLLGVLLMRIIGLSVIAIALKFAWNILRSEGGFSAIFIVNFGLLIGLWMLCSTKDISYIFDKAIGRLTVKNVFTFKTSL